MIDVGTCVVLCLSLSFQSYADDVAPTPVKASVDKSPSDVSGVKAAFAALENASDWRQRRDAANRLGEIGQPALSVIRRGAKRHADDDVRDQCYSLLINHFVDDEQARETIYQHGLSDASTRIRYTCAFSLGEHKVFGAHRRLRLLMEDSEQDQLTRLAAAKSLAQLGEPDAMLFLYDGLGSDYYMSRYISNMGIKAISGKDLNDFGHDFSEGAFVSGGTELRRARRPVEDNEVRSSRYRAIADYFRWLRDDRPELFKHVNGQF